MTEDKKKNLIVAFTIGAVVLVFLLMLIMSFKLVKIFYIKKQTKELDLAIKEYNQLIASGEETYETRQTKAWIIKRAYELGYVFKGDQDLK